jgi:hypothetical protein
MALRRAVLPSRFLPSALAVGLSALGAFGARPARASPLLDTAGPIGGNAGVQGSTSGPGPASTYFNPALLTEAEDQVLLAYVILSEQLAVTLEGRNGGDVPVTVAGRDILAPVPGGGGYAALPNSVVPTQWLQTGCSPSSAVNPCPAPGFAARPRQSQGSSGVVRHYLSLGLVKTVVKDRLTFGLYTLAPLSNFTTANAFFVDEREAVFSNSLHPELYGDRLTAVSLVAGLGVKILPNLSLGVGVSIGLSNNATSADYVQSPTDYSTLLLNNSVTTNVNASPSIGVTFSPLSWLRLAGSAHGPESFGIDTNVTATLPDGTTSGTTQSNVFDWTPWSATLGGEAQVLTRGPYALSIVGTVGYAWWSAYKDRHGMRPKEYGPGLGWSDTPNGAIGTRHTLGNTRAFLDLRYVPSPVPEQVGRSNYVDNDRAGVALGGDVALDLGPVRLRPGVQLFFDRFLPRHNTKNDAQIVDELPDGSIYGSTHGPVPGSTGLQTNNPGWPGYSSAGWLWGGAVTVSTPL